MRWWWTWSSVWSLWPELGGSNICRLPPPPSISQWVDDDRYVDNDIDAEWWWRQCWRYFYPLILQAMLDASSEDGGGGAGGGGGGVDGEVASTGGESRTSKEQADNKTETAGELCLLMVTVWWRWLRLYKWPQQEESPTSELSSSRSWPQVSLKKTTRLLLPLQVAPWCLFYSGSGEICNAMIL